MASPDDYRGAGPPGWRAPSLWYVAGVTVVVGLTWAALSSLARVIDVFFLGFLGVLLATVLQIPIRFLGRWMPRILATVLVLLSIVGVVVGLFLVSLPVVLRQARALVTALPGILDTAARWLEQHLGGGLVQGGQGGPAAKAQEYVLREVGLLAGKLGGAAASVAVTLASILALFALAAFLGYRPRTYLEGLQLLLPARYHESVDRFLAKVGRTLQRWMLGTLFAMAFVGLFIAAGLLVIGIDGWLVLALLSFAGEFVPYLGPILSATPAVILGFARSFETGVWVLVLYLVVMEFEAHVLMPLVMRRAVKLQPAVLILWQLGMAGAFGLWGLVVATPLLATLRVAFFHFYLGRSDAAAAD